MNMQNMTTKGTSNIWKLRQVMAKVGFNLIPNTKHKNMQNKNSNEKNKIMMQGCTSNQCWID